MSFKDLPQDFNADTYSRVYPDVGLSGLDPATHYLKYGKLLGRSPNPVPSAGDTSLRLSKNDPAILDVLYAQGIMPQLEPIRHAELVTILMPSHNNEHWLTRAINSALSQQGVRVEVVVIDDGSTDGSVRVARQIAQTAPNLKVISLLRNFGCYYARNVGVMNSTGVYVTLLDTDDIMTPDRIARQLDAMKTAKGVVASRCRQRRWTPDFTAPVGALKDGENSLLWRRDVMNRVGWYDTVRYSGDGEFRFRLERTFGVAAVLKMPDEMYFTRTLENSLTTSKNSKVFTLQDGQLSVTMSPPRKHYRDQYNGWHKSGAKLKLPFPQFSRPFELGAQAQNASPSLGQLRVGTMASSVARREQLADLLPQILPQLDVLHLYLNDYDEIPDFARDPKIQAVLGKEAAGDLGDAGAFYTLPSENAYVFALADNWTYPADYFARMIYRIEMLGRACVVGVQGEIFPRGDYTELTLRKIFEAASGQIGQFVDMLDTGTAAWHSTCFKPEPDEFVSGDQADLWFAAASARRNVPLFLVPRPKDWLRMRDADRLCTTQEDAYFRTYRDSIAPVLGEGRVRREMAAHLGRCYDRDTLRAAEIVIPGSFAQEAPDLIGTRRSVTHLDPLPVTGRVVSQAPVHFHIIISGWNCQDYLTKCLRSVAQQLPGPYSFDATLIDDHSTDGTYEDLARTAVLPFASLVRITKNTGAAHARHLGITAITDPDTVVVLLDMDDALEPHALRLVAQSYIDRPDCLVAIGNWQDQTGEKNPHSFYTPDEIDTQRTRLLERFDATYLRSFRRHLYDAVEVADLLGPDGEWLESCTDAALMYPLIDQCRADEVAFIDKPIYCHTRNHETAVLARFGAAHRNERLDWLRGKTSKPRLAGRETL